MGALHEMGRLTTTIFLLLFVFTVVMRSTDTNGIVYPTFNKRDQDNPEEFVGPSDNAVTLSGQTSDDPNCLSSSSNLKRLINETDQVVVMMPAKAAGTTWKSFAKACSTPRKFRGNSNIFSSKEHIEGLWRGEYEPPKVIATHMQSDLIEHIVKNAARNTLLVYVHREETSRLKSGISQVLSYRACKCATKPDKCRDAGSLRPDFFETINEKENICVVREEKLVDLIKRDKWEIGWGISKTLNCKVYSAIEEYAPTMVFMNHKDTDTMQFLLSDKYCPDIKPERRNIGMEKSHQVHVLLNKTVHKQSDGDIVSLEDWLTAKSGLLEMAIQHNEKASCVAKTRSMEDVLYSCREGFVQSKTLFNV